MPFPQEHKGFVDKRFWYKVRWTKQPPGESKSLVGVVDLLMDKQYEEYRECVEVVQKIRTPLCASGIALSFGAAAEAAIDEWIRENAEAVE